MTGVRLDVELMRVITVLFAPRLRGRWGKLAVRSGDERVVP